MAEANAAAVDQDIFAAMWHTRRHGWVQGPFSLAQLRRMRDLGWLSRAVPVSIDLHEWCPAATFAVIWDDSVPHVPPPPPPPPPWRYAATDNEQSEPTRFAMLQTMAAIGVLQPNDLVWRDGMTAWRKASAVRGVFGGPMEWCPHCEGPLAIEAVRCGCGHPQSRYRPSHRDVVLPCAILGVCLFPVFPLWLIGIVLGRLDRKAIAVGAMDPAGEPAATYGEILGWIGAGAFVLTAAGVAAWFIWTR
jgi:hypothetical protein